MIANQVIQTSIDELGSITKVDLCVMDLDGTTIATTNPTSDLKPLSVRSFIDSAADSQVISEYHLFKVMDDGVTTFVVGARGLGENSYTIGRVAVSQIQNLIIAYKERFDKNNFFQNLILDNLLLVDIYNRAKKLRIPVDSRRVVFLVETRNEKESYATETLKNMFSPHNGDYVTAVDEKNMILIKNVGANEGYEQMQSIAKMLVDMMNTEAMVRVRVSYGTIVNDIKEVSKSYKEAKMAMDVGSIFYEEKDIVAYNTLGIGRLIYQLPVNLCQIFMHEIFGDDIPDDMDDETITTVNKFFENNLNVSETARQLYVHRNTLVYRIERLEKSTGLDIRRFDDALTLKIAMMVVNYMKYIESIDY